MSYILLAVVAFVSGFFVGHDFALRESLKDVVYLLSKARKAVESDEQSSEVKQAIRKAGSYFMRQL